MDTKKAKQRFGIIGNNSLLERAIDVSLQVAPTDISVPCNRRKTALEKKTFLKLFMKIAKENIILYSCKLRSYSRRNN